MSPPCSPLWRSSKLVGNRDRCRQLRKPGKSIKFKHHWFDFKLHNELQRGSRERRRYEWTCCSSPSFEAKEESPKIDKTLFKFNPLIWELLPHCQWCVLQHLVVLFVGAFCGLSLPQTFQYWGGLVTLVEGGCQRESKL